MEEQKKDPSLAYPLKRLEMALTLGNGGLLLDLQMRIGIVHKQMVLPLGYCLEMMHLADDSSPGGHLGTKKALDQLPLLLAKKRRWKRCTVALSFTPCMPDDGKTWWGSISGPLKPLPIEQEPFSHIMIDCVRPLLRSK